MNPRAAINDLHPFQGCPFSHLGYFSKQKLISYINIKIRWRRYLQRRGWDSNPRALADKRFSRPPRYDHFDTSPCPYALSSVYFLFICRCFYFISSGKNYISKKVIKCQQLFFNFFHFFSNSFLRILSALICHKNKAFTAKTLPLLNPPA